MDDEKRFQVLGMNLTIFCGFPWSTTSRVIQTSRQTSGLSVMWFAGGYPAVTSKPTYQPKADDAVPFPDGAVQVVWDPFVTAHIFLTGFQLGG